jgi:hypothetical protein
MNPELFASADTVADLEAALARDGGSERLASLVALAWHLRQRDGTRALQLAAEADAALTGAASDAPQRKRQEARPLLVRAEANWLHVALDRAAGQARAALAAFADLGDPIGMGDAHWVLASTWGDRGSARHRDENVDAAMVVYSQGSDPIRFDARRARRLLYGGFRDQKGTAIALAQQFDPAFGQPAAVTVWLAGARALVAGAAGNFGNSIQHFMESFQAALECGQLRQAILAATNAADDFSILGDLDTALE